MKVKEIFRGIAVTMIGVLVLSTSIGLLWDLWKGPSPKGIADSYCQANGYAASIDYEFGYKRFFINCTRTTIEECASNQECMHKYFGQDVK